jgi:hypothetical protein
MIFMDPHQDVVGARFFAKEKRLLLIFPSGLVFPAVPELPCGPFTQWV